MEDKGKMDSWRDKMVKEKTTHNGVASSYINGSNRYSYYLGLPSSSLGRPLFL